MKESGDGGSGDRWGGEAGDAGYRAESGDATKETHSRGRVRGGDTGAEEVVVERLGRDGEDGEALAARNRAEALYLQLYGDVLGAEGSKAGSSASRSASPASGAMRFSEVRTKAHRHKCECTRRSLLVLISVITQELEPSVAESFVVSPVASFDSTRLTGARGRCISPTSPPGYASPSSSASPTKNPVAALLSMKIEAFESFLDSQSSAAHFGALGQADGPKMEDMLGGCCHIRDTYETTEDEHVQVSPSPLGSKSETRNRNAYETADHERAQVSSFPPPSFCLSVCMCIQRYEAARFLSLPFFLNACTCALARIWRTQQIQQEGIPFPVSHFFLHP